MDNNYQSSLDWMMWQIDNKQMDDPPLQNLIRAIQYYTEKYGYVPNCCEVSQDWAVEMIVPEGMMLIRSKSTQPGTLFLAQDSSIKTYLPGKISNK